MLGLGVWPQFGILILLALLALLVQFPGGHLGLVLVYGKGTEFSEGKGGSFRGLDLWSGDLCLDSCLDGCLNVIYLVWLGFSTFAGFGSVVLLATLVTRDSVGRALNSSDFTIVPLVSWSCAVSTCGGTWSGVSFGVRLKMGVPLILLVRGLEAAHYGCLDNLLALVGIAELNQMVDVLDVVEEGLSRTALLEVTVDETGYDNVVDCILGVGDGGLACVAGHLEVTLCCDSSDPGGEGFC